MNAVQPGWGALVWFVAIVAAIPLVLWLLKRTPLAGMGQQLPGAPRVVATLPVSQQHRLLTLEVGQGEEKLWLVVGVSPQGMRTLHTMAAQQPAAAAGAEAAQPAPAATFAQLLGRLKGRDGGHA